MPQNKNEGFNQIEYNLKAVDWNLLNASTRKVIYECQNMLM